MTKRPCPCDALNISDRLLRMSHALENVKISCDENAWEIEVRAELPAASLAHYREEMLKEMQKTVQLDGFRKGFAPIDRIIAIYGEGTILKQAAERAIQHELPELLANKNLLIVKAPNVTIEKLEAEQPLAFAAHAPLMPEVKLPDYKRIAATINAKKEEVSVTDEEHKEALTHLRRERARIDKIEAGIPPQKARDESRAMKEEELPALDEAFVQSLGLESVEKFYETVRSNIKTEKELQAREKRRAAILDELVNESSVKYPPRRREYELDDMEARLRADLERMGITFEGYLTQAKKTHEQLRAEWHDAADKRAKVRLILSEIARKESIEADKDRLEKEIAHARNHVPSADPETLRAHISHVLRNEATLNFLEEQK